MRLSSCRSNSFIASGYVVNAMCAAKQLTKAQKNKAFFVASDVVTDRIREYKSAKPLTAWLSGYFYIDNNTALIFRWTKSALSVIIVKVKNMKVLSFLKREPMLTVSVLAAIAALIITPPSWELLSDIDWRTLGTLFMMLTVLEGFKKENIFRPLLGLAGNIRSMAGLSLFLVFSVFFSSMFVTNDVSLIIFVPLTIILFRADWIQQDSAR